MFIKRLYGLILSAFLVVCFCGSSTVNYKIVHDVFTVDNYGDCYYIDNCSDCYYNQYVKLTIARNSYTGEVQYLFVEEIYAKGSTWYYYVNFHYAKEHFNTRQIRLTGKITGSKEFLQSIINDIVVYPAQYPELNVMRPYLHKKTYHEKIKNIITRYNTILQHRDMYIFLGSIVHFEEGDCYEN